jgi:hypothetical protein
MRCNTAYDRPVPLRREPPHRARTDRSLQQCWRAWLTDGLAAQHGIGIGIGIGIGAR